MKEINFSATIGRIPLFAAFAFWMSWDESAGMILVAILRMRIAQLHFWNGESGLLMMSLLSVMSVSFIRILTRSGDERIFEYVSLDSRANPSKKPLSTSG